MNNIYNIFGLKREAILLDSRLYILKAMCAISAGFILGNAFSITRMDMISVMLGVMYNLEAINVSGVKGGINQMLASTLGAMTTGLLVYAMGYNVTVLTVAIGMGLTLYIALIIDYRMVSPVAIFTSIYMSQFIQRDVAGNPSVLLTFQLRIAALGLGILIAITFNYLFSFLYYRQIGRRRLEFAKLQSLIGLNKTIEELSSNPSDHNTNNTILALVFSDIEMVKSNVETMMKETWLPFNLKEKKNLHIIYEVIKSLKIIIHLAYDSNYIHVENNVVVCDTDIETLRNIIQLLGTIDFTQKEKRSFTMLNVLDSADNRISDNIGLMSIEFNKVLSLTQTIQ
ncbi:MAG: hypothetical protein Q8S15_05270 [Erysipelotrichaceae bacterium]|nr:hypothetical protein [Erysipelotrichaceae bacterium]